MPELVFKSDTISDIDAGDNKVNKNSQQISITVTKPGLTNIISIKSKTGQNIKICIMPREQALHATRLELWGQNRLVVTDGANAIANEGNLDILSTGKSDGSFWIYPSPDTVNLAGITLQGKDEGIFRKFDWSVKKKDISVELKQTVQNNNSKYEISIPQDAFDDIYDVYLDIAHVCNYMTAKIDEHLIGDWYFIGKDYCPSLRHWGQQVIGKTISFELTPLTAQTQCFIEDEYRPDFSVKPAYAEIEKVTAIPLYRISFSAVSNKTQETNNIDLSGSWAFQLDSDNKGITEQWYSKQLSDSIKLPGSLQEQGHGEKPSAKTQ